MNKFYNLPVIWELRKLTLYSVFTIKAISPFGLKKAIGSSIADFPIWWKHKKRNLNFLDYDRPWITFQAKVFLDTILNKEMQVFEYGSGSSTLYFSRRVNKIYSVENDKKWFEYLNDYLEQKKVNNVVSSLFEAIACPNENKIYGSTSSEYKNADFKEYVTAIDAFPDENFDIILVDGRARNACIKHALPKLKKGGWLIVDNSERKDYFEGHDFLFDSSLWQKYSFAGPTPYSFGFSETSLFRKV